MLGDKKEVSNAASRFRYGRDEYLFGYPPTLRNTITTNYLLAPGWISLHNKQMQTPTGSKYTELLADHNREMMSN